MNQQGGNVQVDWKPSQFCRGTKCMVNDHDRNPIKQFCFYPECKAQFKQMCIKCIPIHHLHHILPIKIFDDYNTQELQADQKLNEKIDKILAYVKELRESIFKLLDDLESTMTKMKSVSLEQIVNSFRFKSCDTANVSALQKEIEMNVRWNSGKMEIKRLEHDHIYQVFEKELKKVENCIQVEIDKYTKEAVENIKRKGVIIEKYQRGQMQVLRTGRFSLKRKNEMDEMERMGLELICGGDIHVYEYFGVENMGQSGLSFVDFDPKYNKTWSANLKQKEERGPKGLHRYDYFYPRGWNGYALKVIDKYEDNDWLKKDGNKEEWRIFYHGTQQQYLQSILQNGLLPGQRQLYAYEKCHLTGLKVGKGVSFTNHIEVAEQYSDHIQMANKIFKLVLQVRARPQAIRQIRRVGEIEGWDNDYFVVNNTYDIRPYRILLKQECNY